jgi:hypothetical protein
VIVGDWTELWDLEDPRDVEAYERKLEFAISWFADPIYHGKYPDSMLRSQIRTRGGQELQRFLQYESYTTKHLDAPTADEDYLDNIETLIRTANASNQLQSSFHPRD